MSEPDQAPSNASESTPDLREAGFGPLGFFIGSLVTLAAIKVGLAFVSVPERMIGILSILVTIVFVAIPVYVLFRAASVRWTAKLGLLLVAAGLVVHVGLQVLGGKLLSVSGFGGATLLALRDVGFFTWCVGLGATLASLLKDKNLLIPVSVFLAGFDIFLVLTPIGPVKQILKAAPEIPQAMALNLPAPTAEATGGAPTPFAIIGPADFVFMAMFFIALYRFGMSVRSTAQWLAPAILVYLGLAFFVGPVPLLVPIGVTVLAVNWKQFRLNGEEWASTAVVAAAIGGAIWWGATRPPPPVEIVEPSPSVSGPGVPESAGSPEQAPPDRSP